MRSFLLKAAVFSVVSLATWMATSSIVAQQKVGRQSGRPVRSSQVSAAKPSSTHTQVQIESSRPGPAAQHPTGSVDGLASMHLTKNEITVDEGMATVNVGVSIMDKRQGQAYIWRLRVVAPNGTPLAGMVYNQQMFAVENGQKEVIFSDTVPVPAGAKRVEVVLYEKSPKEDLSFLDDNDAARAHQVIRAVKLLTK